MLFFCVFLIDLRYLWTNTYSVFFFRLRKVQLLQDLLTFREHLQFSLTNKQKESRWRFLHDYYYFHCILSLILNCFFHLKNWQIFQLYVVFLCFFFKYLSFYLIALLIMYGHYNSFITHFNFITTYNWKICQFFKWKKQFNIKERIQWK
jgi:hypothetical protein